MGAGRPVPVPVGEAVERSGVIGSCMDVPGMHGAALEEWVLEGLGMVRLAAVWLAPIWLAPVWLAAVWLAADSPAMGAEGKDALGMLAPTVARLAVS